ncbi:MAG: IgGFc-binding protein [Candidatus Kapaibacteriales bacterium]
MKTNSFAKFLIVVSIVYFSIFLPMLIQSQTIEEEPTLTIDSLKLSKHQKIKVPIGREFWLCFMRNYNTDNKKGSASELFLELFITSEENANVKIEIPALGYRTSLFVRAKEIREIRLPSEAEILSNQTIEKLSVHITSDNPISVYGLNRRFMTTDTYLAFPTEVLGTEYRTMCYTALENQMPIFAIIATENNTEVTIIPSANTTRSSKGVPFTITLNRGDVYQVASIYIRGQNSDLTGTYIRANKKIAVFSGHQCAYVPPTVIACNHLVEQIPPISSWGKHFYLGQLKPRQDYTLRVLAHEPHTKVFIDSRLVRTLGAGEFFDSIVNKAIQISASKPILVAQFSHGYRWGDSIGDPMMILVSPTLQFLKSYRFATPVNGYWRHMVNVVVPINGIKSMRLDGVPIDSSLFQPLGSTRYAIAYLQVPFGSHSLEGDLPFGMYSYGFGYDQDAFDAYGTMGGQSFIEYEPARDTLPPYAEGSLIDNSFAVFVRDDREDDTGISGVSILNNEGFSYIIPKIDEGTPQLAIKFSPFDRGISSRIVFVVTDLAMNESIWTVCYAPDPSLNKFEFQISKGLGINCKVDPGFYLGLFGKVALGIHSPNFSSSGNITSFGQFQNSSGIGGFFGAYFSRMIADAISFTAHLTLENYASKIEAPDSSTSKIRQEDGSLILFQEGRMLSLDGLFLSLNLNMDYFLWFRFYVSLGFAIDLPLSKAVTFTRYIIKPSNYTYSNESKELAIENINSINTLNSYRISPTIAFGHIYQFTPRISFISEIRYKLPLTSLISIGKWYYHTISLNIGVRYRF